MFWVSIAVMFASAAMIEAFGRLERISVGSMGEWVSGIMAGAGVLAALGIAANEARRARALVEAQRREKIEAARLAMRAELVTSLMVYVLALDYFLAAAAKMEAELQSAAQHARSAMRIEIYDEAMAQLRSVDLRLLEEVDVQMIIEMRVRLNMVRFFFASVVEKYPVQHDMPSVPPTDRVFYQAAVIVSLMFARVNSLGAEFSLDFLKKVGAIVQLAAGPIRPVAKEKS